MLVVLVALRVLDHHQNNGTGMDRRGGMGWDGIGSDWYGLDGMGLDGIGLDGIGLDLV